MSIRGELSTSSRPCHAQGLPVRFPTIFLPVTAARAVPGRADGPKSTQFNNGVADRQYVNYPSLARPAYGPAPTLSQPARCSLAFTTLERRESLLLGKSTRVRPGPAPCHLGGAGTTVPGV